MLPELHKNDTTPAIPLGVFAILLLLTAITTGVAFIDLGPFNLVVAITIAFLQALLAIVYFMHVRGSTNTVKLCVIVAVVWLVLLISGVLMDVLTRNWSWEIR